MSRQPMQIHVYLYKRSPEGSYEFAVFQRADNELWWQGICGGVEDDETAESAARRESFEEAGIDDKLPLYRLDTVSYLPAGIFHTQTQAMWGKDIVVVPVYFFAMPFNGIVRLSNEHKQLMWLPYEEAQRLVYFHDQKTALWELRERLLRGNLVR